MPITSAVKIDLTGTPEKFRSVAEEIFLLLENLLEELGRLEDQFFVQAKRLRKKGRVIIFENSIREEITRHEDLKAKYSGLYRQLLDPHCTEEMLAQRKGCSHGETYPSCFDCLHTGCTIMITMKSAGKAVVDLLPDDGPVPYNMKNPDVRYIAEDFTNNPPHFYTYFMKYRFTMKLVGDEWKIDAVQNGGTSDSRWRRDYYF